MTTVLCVPQWQGSAAPNAPRLMAGARRVAELVPCDTRVTLPVRETAGERDAGVRSFDVIEENAGLIRKALADTDDFVVTVGGDCGVDLAPIAAAHARYGDELTVLWIDAHPDLYTPQTLSSGSFHGMVLRTLLGDGHTSLVPDRPLRPEQVVFAGRRAGDDSELEYLARNGMRSHGVADFEAALEGLSGPVYAHIDLDVLEPIAFASMGYPVPDGVSPHRLIDLVSSVDGLVGAAITEYAPADPTDEAEADIIRRVGAALRS
ncbi:arginase family protein [Allokutzneria sp. NRRL B-24872]|uniref:arginase family protein n=1 Tax=Allokutzneria sp. NRRL B-24872 TaxID=1137961 RepID=UPI001AEFDA38|nr:arginase family protein [Allokutzneria sp. NRRL B-24872]